MPNGAIVNWPLRRLLLSRFANLYIRLVTRLDVRDCTTGYRCWRRAALAELPLDRISSDGYSFLVETLYMAARRGARIAEVPITFVERRQGESKLSRAVLLESVLMPWRLIGAHDRPPRADEACTEAAATLSCYLLRFAHVWPSHAASRGSERLLPGVQRQRDHREHGHPQPSRPPRS